MVSLQTSQPELQQIRDLSETFPSIRFFTKAAVRSGKKKNLTFSKITSSTDLGNNRFSDILTSSDPTNVHGIKVNRNSDKTKERTK